MKRRIVARRNNVFSTFHFHYFIISLFHYFVISIFNIQYYFAFIVINGTSISSMEIPPCWKVSL